MPTWTLDGAGLHLRRTLDSGQAFRWRWEPGLDGTEVATGIVGRHVVRVEQHAREIRLLRPASPTARDALAAYLALDPAPAATGRTPLEQVQASLAADPVLARILPHTRGIGLLVQDPWEVLISFIISQNNNIPKIARSIEHLSAALGEPIGEGAHAFPTPARLAAAHPATLRACHLGYRAPYVREAARRVLAGRLDLDALRRRPEDEAREALQQLPGVGEKVADCILLFALGHLTTFPIDVWVKRAVECLYFRTRPQPLRDLRAFSRARFGPLAGYAQQHLFAYARAHLGTSRVRSQAAPDGDRSILYGADGRPSHGTERPRRTGW